MLVPKLVTTLKDYTRQQFANDLLAGVIVGVVALPLAIAFAIASGVTPQAGLYTAIIAGFIISSLGGSRVQIGGPTGAFVVIVYGIVQRYGIEGLTIATVMAGLILIALGLAGLGGAIKFIPFPVTTGFTAGIAVVIFSGQIKDLLGLEMGPVPAEFVEKWRSLGQHLGSFNPAALGTALAAVLIIQLYSEQVKSASLLLVHVEKAFVELVPKGFDCNSVNDFAGERVQEHLAGGLQSDAAGTKIVMATHNLGQARRLGDEVIYLQAGRVMERAPKTALFAAPRHPYTRALLASTPKVGAIRGEAALGRAARTALSGELPSPLAPPSGCVFRTRCPHAIPACAEAVPPLVPVGADHEAACIRLDQI